MKASSRNSAYSSSPWLKREHVLHTAPLTQRRFNTSFSCLSQGSMSTPNFPPHLRQCSTTLLDAGRGIATNEDCRDTTRYCLGSRTYFELSNKIATNTNSYSSKLLSECPHSFHFQVLSFSGECQKHKMSKTQNVKTQAHRCNYKQSWSSCCLDEVLFWQKERERQREKDSNGKSNESRFKGCRISTTKRKPRICLHTRFADSNLSVLNMTPFRVFYHILLYAAACILTHLIALRLALSQLCLLVLSPSEMQNSLKYHPRTTSTTYGKFRSFVFVSLHC